MSRTSFTTRSARLTAVAACSVAALQLAGPASAAVTPPLPDGAPVASTTSARAGTGALVSKGLSARTVLTSTSGKKINLGVSASTASGSGTSVTISLTNASETHAWTFKARSTDFKMGSTGAGTLTLSTTQTGNRGRLSLKFGPVAAMRTRSCGGQVASKTRRVSVSGIAFFKTGTTRWGNVGRATKAISFAGANQALWSYDVTCPTPKPACTTGLTWSAYTFAGTTMTGVSGQSNGTKASASGFRSVTLASPAGATRMDFVTLASVPLPSFSGTTDAAVVQAKAGGGSLTLDGHSGFASSTPCGASGSMTTTQWSASVANGSPALRIPAQVFGAFAAGPDSMGSFGRTVS